MDLNEMLDKLNTLARDIRRLGKAVGYNGDDELEDVRLDESGAQDLFLYDELLFTMRQLSKAAGNVEYLKRPIRNAGRLHKAGSGRYAFPDGEELPCGHGVELLVADWTHARYIKDDYTPVPYWKAGRIEHDGDDYYFTGSRETPLDGAQARIR